MPTILKKIFKPKWQSASPEARIEAVASLQWESEEERQILLQLVQSDPHTLVKQKAARKIGDASLLLKLLSDADESLQNVICLRLDELLHQTPEPTLRVLTEELSDDALRVILIQKLTPLEHRLALLKTLQSPQRLADVACQHPTSRIRQQAAEFLQDESLLEQVLKASKNKDKGVYQIVKTKLNASRDIVKREQALQQQAEEFCAALEAHAVSEVVRFYEAKYEALLQHWQTVEENCSEDVAGRAQRASKTCAERVRRMKEDEALRLREAQENAGLLKEREATCETLEQALNSLRQQSNHSRADLSALDALLKTQENRWLEATRETHVDKSEQKRYQNSMHELRHFQATLQKFLGKESEIQALLANHEPADSESSVLPQLRQALAEINWPDEFARPQILNDAEASLGQLREIKKQQADDLKKMRHTVEKTVAQLEKELDERSLKNSSRLYKDLQKLVHRLPHSQEQDFHGKLRLLYGRLQELRDWQGYATQPKQLELCERMEHLAQQHLDPQLKAQRIKELQNEWRALGGSSDQGMWIRFKTASDQAYEPCQAFFAEHDLLKQTNLDKREMICEQLQNFLDHIHWEAVDWKAMDKISRKAREEWHRFYPVDHKRNKPVQKQFHKLMDELESHLNEERQRNAELKKAIVQRAEELATGEDVRAATQAAKQLQKDWESIGITEHREDRQLWKSFRAACDKIFSRLELERNHHHQEIQQRINQAEAICAEIEQLAAQSATDALPQVQQHQHAFKELGHLPREVHQRLQDRIHQATQVLRDRTQQQQAQAQRQKWQLLSQYAEQLAQVEDARIAGQEVQAPAMELPELDADLAGALIARVERLPNVAVADYESHRDQAQLLAIQAEIAAGLESPEADRGKRMEYQMSRLSNGLAGHQPPRRPWDELLNILIAWYGLGPVDPDQRQALQSRIDRALEQLLTSQAHRH